MAQDEPGPGQLQTATLLDWVNSELPTILATLENDPNLAKTPEGRIAHAGLDALKAAAYILAASRGMERSDTTSELQKAYKLLEAALKQISKFLPEDLIRIRSAK
jgi:hypothetical protein